MAKAVRQDEYFIPADVLKKEGSWKRIEYNGEVAYLLLRGPFGIHGEIPPTKVGRKYTAYLVYQLAPDHRNVDEADAEIRNGAVIIDQRKIYPTRDGTPSIIYPGWLEVAFGNFEGTGSILNFSIKGGDEESFGLILKGVAVREEVAFAIRTT